MAYNTLLELKLQAEQLHPLAEALKNCSTHAQKIKVLRNDPRVQKEHLALDSDFRFVEQLPPVSQVIIDSIFAIGQTEQIFQGIKAFKNKQNAVLKLLEQLQPVEQFYAPIGGIVGYHLKFLNLLLDKESLCHLPADVYEKPPGYDLSANTPEVHFAVRSGIENLDLIADIYPVAGAADRLDLHHEITGEPLPAAELSFLGCTLLEGLIRDIQAREYLHFKLIGKQVTTPLVLMTSLEKNNHLHILSILENNHWFKRPPDKFFTILQPLVPVIRKDGKWATSAPLQILFKPGGHGVIWKLARDQGAFQWLKKQKKSKALVRQINNPIAGTDNTLLALAGIGIEQNKAFGFVSCERITHSTEGMVVLIEHKENSGFETKITNIEYTDFEQQGIKDEAEKPTSPFSRFPANTNILFADICSIERALKKCSFPGMLINLKSMTTCLSEKGAPEKIEAARLESTMQNIADYISVKSKERLTDKEKHDLPTFVAYNSRQKTIAVTKKTWNPGQPIRETPEGVFYTIHENNCQLLERLGFKVPKAAGEAEFIENGPSFFFSYHPALGPLYSVIAQKLRGGKLSLGAELRLEITEVDISTLNLKGSLIVQADTPLGSTTPKGTLKYTHNSGKCTLLNCTVENKGAYPAPSSAYWRDTLDRHESLTIHLEGNAEFLAENVHFKGLFNLIVPNGYRMVARQEDGKVSFTLNKIPKSTWYWEYSFSADNRILLKKIMN